MKKTHIITYQPGVKSLRPRIIIQGEWLKQLGYNVGEQCIITIVGDVLVIRKSKSEFWDYLSNR